jgi:hypothetical protein
LETIESYHLKTKVMKNNILKKLFLVFLLAPMAFFSCVSYKDIKKVYQPWTLDPGDSKTFPLDYFEGVSQGDKIQVKDKSQKNYYMEFSSVFEGNLNGRVIKDPVTMNKVEPYDYSIPIHRISQVSGIGKGSEMKDKPQPDFYYSDLYKIRKGEKILVKERSGEIQYMSFNELKNGRIYGDSWGSEKKDNTIESKKVEIPLQEIDQIQVKRFKPLQTFGLVAGITVGTFVVAYAISPPDYGF